MVILGKRFIYRGFVEAISDLPPVIGVYYIRELCQYCVVHLATDSDISKAYAEYRIKLMSKNPAPVIKERIHKEAFVVPITDDDKPLKVLIKKILLKERIDIRCYKEKFGDDNYMNNMKRLITGNGNLTYEKFRDWLDILGYKHDVILFDQNGNPFNSEYDET